MADESNIQVVRKLFEAFNERRFDDLEGTVFSPALVWRHHGKESDLLRWIRDARSCVVSFPDAELVLQSERADGDRVKVTFRFRGTHLGLFAGAAPSGHAFDIAGSSTLRILDGLIVEDDEHLDEEALIRQLALT